MYSSHGCEWEVGKTLGILNYEARLPPESAPLNLSRLSLVGVGVGQAVQQG